MDFVQTRIGTMGIFLFMDKRFSQLELFSQERGDEPGQSLPEKRPFMLQVNNFEKVIFFIIALIITGVSAFCFGIERGKAIAMRSGSNRFDLASTPVPRRPQPQAVAAAPARPAVQQGVVREIKVPEPVLAGKQQASIAPLKNIFAQGSYTIQVGTYQMKDAAEREIQYLVRKGFSPQVSVTRSGYNVVCVGNFANKETAKSLLSRLRQSYRDCYIRRL